MSFNINGIRARIHQMETLFQEFNPDVVGFQETKVADEQFPEDLFQEMGLHVTYHGQKGHYGVALVSKQPPQNVRKGLPDDEADAQKRLIVADYQFGDTEISVLNGYFPQGSDRDHPVKFPQKRAFYEGLQDYLERDFDPKKPVLLMGDFNIAPLDLDVGIGEKNAKRWLRTGKCSFLPEEREWYERLMGWGFEDAYRKHHPDDDQTMSWFDYRSRGFDDDPKRGLRIDTLLVSQPLYRQCKGAGIDYDLRAGERPSDHCPVWADFALG